jgi:hypothetical protein
VADTAPHPTRGVLDRPCPICDRFTFGADWPEHPEITYPEPTPVDDFTLRCSFCEHTEDASTCIRAGRVRELIHELREDHAEPRSEWWTKRQAVVELDMTMRSLDNYIRDGLGTYTVERQVYVNVEEVLIMWRSKRMKRNGTFATPRSA